MMCVQAHHPHAVQTQQNSSGHRLPRGRSHKRCCATRLARGGRRPLTPAFGTKPVTCAREHKNRHTPSWPNRRARAQRATRHAPPTSLRLLPLLSPLPRRRRHTPGRAQSQSPAASVPARLNRQRQRPTDGARRDTRRSRAVTRRPRAAHAPGVALTLHRGAPFMADTRGDVRPGESSSMSAWAFAKARSNLPPPPQAPVSHQCTADPRPRGGAQVPRVPPAVLLAARGHRRAQHGLRLIAAEECRRRRCRRWLARTLAGTLCSAQRCDTTTTTAHAARARPRHLLLPSWHHSLARSGGRREDPAHQSELPAIHFCCKEVLHR